MPQPSRPGFTEAPDFALAEEVDNGEYFRRGRAWARMLYDLPMVERSLALLALTIILLTWFCAYLVLGSFDPLSRPVSLAFENPNLATDIPRIVPLAGNDRAPLQQAVARYIAKKYVIARESYKFDREAIDSQYRLVYNTSAPQIFDVYRALLTPSNPNSPLAKYERHTTVAALYPVSKVEISDPKNGVVYGKALVVYSERKSGTSGFQQNRRTASLEFSMAEISVHSDDNRVYQYNPGTGKDEPLTGQINFRVTSYQSPTESSAQ